MVVGTAALGQASQTQAVALLAASPQDLRTWGGLARVVVFAAHPVHPASQQAWDDARAHWKQPVA